MNTKKIHFLSGLTLTVFIGVHLFNHFMSIFGEEAHIEWMNTLRMVYRNIFIELIILVAVGFQIFTGIKLYLSKRKVKGHFFHQLQIWTGLYLAFFLVIHVGAVLGGRLILNLDTNFYFGVAGLNSFPFYLFFIPYYGLAILAFFGHLSAIHHQKMKNKILGMTVDQQARFILAKGVFVMIIILYGLTGGFMGIEIPEAYQVLIGK